MVLSGLKIHVFIKNKQTLNQFTASFFPSSLAKRKQASTMVYIYSHLAQERSRAVLASQTGRIWGYVCAKT